MNHAGDKHPTNMGVFSRRVSLKLKLLKSKKIFEKTLVTTDDRVAQRIYFCLSIQPKTKKLKQTFNPDSSVCRAAT